MEKVTVEAVTIWMLLAMIIGLITCFLYRKRKIKASTAITFPLFIFYFVFILTITIVQRTPSSLPQYELDLFWSYKKILSGSTTLLAENFWNVVMFVPLSIMLGIVFDFDTGVAKRRSKWIWMTVIVCFLISAGIEVVQLMTHRGLFEFDDMIHNTFGAVIGAIAVAVVRR